jgi:hypothetical protein
MPLLSRLMTLLSGFILLWLFLAAMGLPLAISRTLADSFLGAKEYLFGLAGAGVLLGCGSFILLRGLARPLPTSIGRPLLALLAWCTFTLFWHPYAAWGAIDLALFAMEIGLIVLPTITIGWERLLQPVLVASVLAGQLMTGLHLLEVNKIFLRVSLRTPGLTRATAMLQKSTPDEIGQMLASGVLFVPFFPESLASKPGLRSEGTGATMAKMGTSAIF